MMGKKLHRKLNRSNRKSPSRKALSIDELKGLLLWLRKNSSVRSRADYAIVYMLVTSGLRGSELCSFAGEMWSASKGVGLRGSSRREAARLNRNCTVQLLKLVWIISKVISSGSRDPRMLYFGLSRDIRETYLDRYRITLYGMESKKSVRRLEGRG